MSHNEAQQHVDRIQTFQEELAHLEEEQILTLTPEQKHRLASYHDARIKSLFTTFDIDISARHKQLSLGMKVTSFLGALAFAIGLLFLFRYFWGIFPTAVQAVILVITPLVAIGITRFFSLREKTGYYAKIAALVAFAAFVLNLNMLGSIFNISPSENALLLWSILALLLAYASDTRLMLGIGISSLAGFISAKTATQSGVYWISFGEYPEYFFPAALIIFMLSFAPHRTYRDFQPIYRTFGLLLIFLPMLVLANWGEASYLPLSADTVATLYQLLGFFLSGAVIYLGVIKGWNDSVTTGNFFFTLFIYTKLFDWWWEWMPKYLFFLILGLVAVGMLWIFKRLRMPHPVHAAQGA